MWTSLSCMLNFTTAPTFEVFVSQLIRYRVSIVVPYLDFWLSRVFINRQWSSFTLPTGISDWGIEVSSPKIWWSPLTDMEYLFHIWSRIYSPSHKISSALLFDLLYLTRSNVTGAFIVNAPPVLIEIHVALVLFSMLGIFVNSVCSCLVFPMILSLSTVFIVFDHVLVPLNNTISCS